MLEKKKAIFAEDSDEELDFKKPEKESEKASALPQIDSKAPAKKKIAFAEDSEEEEDFGFKKPEPKASAVPKKGGVPGFLDDDDEDEDDDDFKMPMSKKKDTKRPPSIIMNKEEAIMRKKSVLLDDDSDEDDFNFKKPASKAAPTLPSLPPAAKPKEQPKPAAKKAFLVDSDEESQRAPSMPKLPVLPPAKKDKKVELPVEKAPESKKEMNDFIRNQSIADDDFP